MKNQQGKQQEAAAAAASAASASQQQQDPAQQTSNTPDQTNQSTENEQLDEEPVENDQVPEAEESEEESEDEEEELYQIMVGRKVNKAGMVVHKKSGTVLGRLVEGKIKRVSGKKVGENGVIVNDKGKMIGRVEPVRQESSEEEEEEGEDSDDDQGAVNENEETNDDNNESDKVDENTNDDEVSKTENAATESTDEDSRDINDNDIENVNEDSKDTIESAAKDDKDKPESDKDTITSTKDETEDTTDDTTKEATKDIDDETAKDDHTQEPIESTTKHTEKEVQGLEVGDTQKNISNSQEDEEKKPFNPYNLIDKNSSEVRKSGKVVDMQDNVIGAVNKGMAPKLAGFKVDKEGNVVNHEGHVVAKADLYVPGEEEEKPYNPNPTVKEDSPEVRKSGKIVDNEDNIVGTIDKELASKLVGSKVNKDGNVIDPEGHIVARADLIKGDDDEEPTTENKPFNPNEMVDENSPEVKKSGKVLDMDDNLVGHVDKRVTSKLAGFKVDEEGNVINHEGHIVGGAEMIKPQEPEEEDDDKPFNPNPSVHEDSPEVRKSGKVLDMDDNIVGHVDKQLAVKLASFKVDPDGNIINDKGHVVGKADILKEEQEQDMSKPFNPNTMVDEHSPKVRKSGKVVDEDDNVVGTVNKSAAHKLAGFPVDDDGNIINKGGRIVGKAKMHGHMTEKERKQQAEEEEYRKIADQMSQAVQQSLDKIKPILKQITDAIDDEEAKPQKERNEQKLVDHVKPLIQQGSSILEETNGAIRGLDPSGRIAKKAQGRTSERRASPEEHHLADLLAQISGEVTTTIDKAKKKVRNMPHAKKELGPLWNILQSPLLQILSGVGLLLTGVLGLVGSLLNSLGLGHIINSVLGGIGLNKILEGFGLGNALSLASSNK